MVYFWFNVTGTSTGTYVHIYSGTCAGGLTSIGTCFATAANSAAMTANTKYYIQVHTSSSSLTTNFSLCGYPSPPPPANDDCAGALPLLVSTSSGCDNKVSGTTSAATASSEADCSTCSKDVWYTFTPATTGSYNFSVENF